MKWRLISVRWGFVYVLEDETGKEIASFEAPQLHAIRDLFGLPDDVRNEIFRKAKDLHDNPDKFWGLDGDTDNSY